MLHIISVLSTATHYCHIWFYSFSRSTWPTTSCSVSSVTFILALLFWRVIVVVLFWIKVVNLILVNRYLYLNGMYSMVYDVIYMFKQLLINRDWSFCWTVIQLKSQQEAHTSVLYLVYLVFFCPKFSKMSVRSTFILCHVSKQKTATSMKIKYEMEALSC